MKHIKKIILFALLILTISSTVKSLNAEEAYTINKVTPITNKSLEIELNKKTNLAKGSINSDFKIYKDIKINDITKDSINLKKVVVNINGSFKENSSYSILLISWAEWNIEFKTKSNFIWTEIKNNNLEDIQSIEKVIIKTEGQIEIYFLQNLIESDIELRLYKEIFVDKTIKNEKIKILLKTKLENNSKYISTITLLEDNKLKKIDIENWIYEFSTSTLDNYNNELSQDSSLEDKVENSSKKNSLEDKFLSALEWIKVGDISDNLLNEESEISDELNSASDDPENKEQTQLERLALWTEETPDTGAETWVLIFGTFIINTFYFLSRRKKNKIAK